MTELTCLVSMPVVSVTSSPISDLCLDAVSLSESCYLKRDTRHKALNCRGMVEESVCEFGRQCHPLQRECSLNLCSLEQDVN